MLTDAIITAQENTRLALQKLTNLTNGEFISCLQLNISVCEFTQKSANNIVVTVFNPLARPVRQYVRVPVLNYTYVVTDVNGKEIKHQIVPVPAEVLALTNLRNNTTQDELVFEAYVEKLESYYIKIKPSPKYYEYDVVNSDNELVNNRMLRYQNLRASPSSLAQRQEVQTQAAGDIIVENSVS